MNKAGIVSGVSDTLFDPDRNITRAEFAAIIARALKLADKTADFKDVNGEWFAPYVGACSDAGIITGYDGYFRPNDNITRQEMAVIPTLKKRAQTAESITLPIKPRLRTGQRRQ